MGAFKLTEQSADHSGSSHTERMTECNGSSFWVQFLVVDSQFIHTVGSLTGKCFIDFKDINVIQLESTFLKCRRYGVSRSNSHDVRRHTRNSTSNQSSNYGQIMLLSETSSSKHNSSGTVRNLRWVTRGGGSSLFESRTQFAQNTDGGGFTDSFILWD